MGAILMPLLVWASVSLVLCQTEVQPVCSRQPTSSIHLSVDSLRNKRGNWVTKVDLERGGGRGQMEAMRTEPWSVDVDANTRTCEGAESTLHVSLTLTAPLRTPSPDYELLPGIGYYKYHPDVTTWPLARETCAKEGAHLVIINSERENQAMKTWHTRFANVTTGATHKDWAWIGIERNKDDEFFTILGDSLNSTGFERWDSGQPNKGQYCGIVHLVRGGLGDTDCPSKQTFICEQEL